MIREQKRILRKKIKGLKGLLSLEEKLEESALIFKKLEALECFQKANIVMVYWSMDDEVHTHDFIEKWWKKKTILLPVVSGDILILRPYTGRGCMKPGELMGILEPHGSEFTDLSSIDLIVVPGVAFDTNNNRMGRGKGYYDKLLQATNAQKIGVGFKLQMVGHVPLEPHDKPMNRVISS